jgi:DNA-3-methyladenine glycosylase I
MSRAPRLHADGLTRCPWPGEDPLYVAYHDTEWGVPEHDDRALFEKLILDGFQAGLSWITILRKRDNFRRAFDDFQPDRIARYDDKKIHALMNDAGIVRNRAKIEGTIASAKSWLAIQQHGPGFSALLWDFVGGEPKVNRFKTTASVPASTPLSIKVSKDLGSRGFKFVGPTIVYAFMQATGMVNDHLVDCFCHQTCSQTQRARRLKVK